MEAQGMPTAPHFVLVPFVAQGHLIPMADLAHLLAEQGAQVSLITTAVNGARIQPVVDRVMRSNLAIEFVVLPFPASEHGLPDGCENADLLPDNKDFLTFMKATYDLQEPFEQFLRSQRPLPSCVISDGCNPWTMDVVRRVGVPRRLVFHGPSCFYNLCDHNVMAHGIYSRVTDDLETFLVPDMPVQVKVNKATGPGFFNAPGWEKFRDDAAEAARTADGLVLNTFQELEAEFIECYKKALDRPVWTLGPFCLSNKDDEAVVSRGNKADVSKHTLLAWLDNMETKSVIYVSFGTVARKQPAQLIEIGHGLEAAGWPFVWVVKEAELATPELKEWLKQFEERTGEKGFIVRGWAPQLAILAHRAVGGFLTHCGWNSMLEAIAMGVPMVTWPHFADQFLNERLAVDVLGVGVPIGASLPIDIFSSDVSTRRDDVQKAVSRLMDRGREGEERREKAMEFGRKAHVAMEKGGSSYVHLTQLVDSFMQNGCAKVSAKEP